MVLVIALVVLLSSCHSEGSEADMRTANELLAQMQTANYRGFVRAPGWTTPHQAATIEHHGDFLDIYLNPTLSDSIAGGGMPPWPIGSIIIKDGWNDAGGTALFQISILHKTAADAWFGGEFNSDAEATHAGTNFEECNGCHAAGMDYLLAF